MKNRKMIGALLCTLALFVSGIAMAGSKEKKAGKVLAGYNAVVVEKFSVDPSARTADFPRGQEVGIQQNVVERLNKQKVFEEVKDGLEAGAAPPVAADLTANAPAKRAVILSGTVIEYDKGSREARWFVGMGAGATKVKVRFVFRDAQTGAELLRTDRQGQFYGWIAFVGGSKEQATGEAAGDVVDRLMDDIKKNR